MGGDWPAAFSRRAWLRALAPSTQPRQGHARPPKSLKWADGWWHGPGTPACPNWSFVQLLRQRPKQHQRLAALLTVVVQLGQCSSAIWLLSTSLETVALLEQPRKGAPQKRLTTR